MDGLLTGESNSIEASELEAMAAWSLIWDIFRRCVLGDSNVSELPAGRPLLLSRRCVGEKWNLCVTTHDRGGLKHGLLFEE